MIQLSIIIPVFNKPEYLDNCLLSINKFIGNTTAIEIIIVTDNVKYSNDYSMIASKYDFPNLKMINHQCTLGPGISRNDGLTAAIGKFIQFMDDDDEYKDDPLIYCDDNFDIISTTYQFLPWLSINATEWCGGLHGIIFSNNLISDKHIKFIDLRSGWEDCLFRAVSFLSTTKIKYINKTFYNRIYRQDSTFGTLRPIILDTNLKPLIDNILFNSLLIKYYPNIEILNKTIYDKILEKTLKSIIKLSFLNKSNKYYNQRWILTGIITFKVLSSQLVNSLSNSIIIDNNNLIILNTNDTIKLIKNICPQNVDAIFIHNYIDYIYWFTDVYYYKCER